VSPWIEFLNSLSDHHHVCLVGPLLGRSHVAVMPTIYVDGGSDYRADGGWAGSQLGPPAEKSSIPLVSIGDGDSAAGRLDEVLPAHKDYSDLAFALRNLPQNIVAVEMLGFLGERRDHELANLGEVHAFLKTRADFCRVEIHSASQTVFAFARGALTIDISGTFSVMMLEPTPVKIEGACEYKLGGDVVLPVASSRGLSNVGFGEVTITSDQPCFVFLSR
jgi:thiamine pyrophosphokinase